MFPASGITPPSQRFTVPQRNGRARRRRALTLLAVLVLLANLAVPGAAFAQEEPPDGSGADGSIPTYVVPDEPLPLDEVSMEQEPGPPLPEVAEPAGDLRVFLPMAIGSREGLSSPTSGDVIPGEYVVVLKPAAERAATSPNGVAVTPDLFAQSLVSVHGGAVQYVYDAVLEGFAAALPDSALAALEADPMVDFVEPNRVIVEDAIQYPATWGLDRVDQRYLPRNSRYTYNATGAGVHLYVIDGGVHLSHNEFYGRVGNAYSSINDGRGAWDCTGHGTHVAGTAAGSTYGVAKRAVIHSVRVLGCQGGSTSSVLAGMNWVRTYRIRPAVANMSLGGPASASIDQAVNSLIAAGVTVVVAAGNDNRSACIDSPSRVPAALTVGATDVRDYRSSFSNYGFCVDIFAPGTAIASAWNYSNSAAHTISGTSMAAPHVAGAAALVLQVTPSALPATVAAVLLNASTVNRIVNVGYGSPNRLLFTPFIGAPANSCTQRLVNASFESGATGWSQTSTRGYRLICTNCGAVSPLDGAWKAWLGGADNELSAIQQTVVLPAGQSAAMSYGYAIRSSDACGFDIGQVYVIANGTSVLMRQFPLCASSATSSWRRDVLDLGRFAGSTIRILFRAINDSSYPSDFYIDRTNLLTGAYCFTPASSEFDGTAAELETVPADWVQPKPTGAAPDWVRPGD